MAQMAAPVRVNAPRDHAGHVGDERKVQKPPRKRENKRHGHRRGNRAARQPLPEFSPFHIT